jgi:hypothetical protein
MITERKRVYIVVKTYPSISTKYVETVCTAGVTEDGSWVRLYPIKFRMLQDDQKYKKFSWIELDVERNTSDFRPESYRPLNLDTAVVTEEVKTKSGKPDWNLRRKILFSNQTVFTNLSTLIAKAKVDGTSLAIFKPAKIVDFVIESIESEWDLKKLQNLQAQSQQLNLFQTPEEIEQEFKIVQKVPYQFSYRLEDDSGKQSTMMIEDWEIGMLYFNCLKNSNDDEKVAIEKVKQKYIAEFSKRDLYLILGTTKQFHNVAPNPFIIIGVFYPPMPSPQMNIFDLTEEI